MTARRPWLPALGAALLLAPPAAVAGPKADAAGDPLPAGAVARLGTDRLRTTLAEGAVLLPPAYTTFAVADSSSGGLRLVDAATGAPAGKVGGRETFGGSLAAVSADGRRAVVGTYNAAVVWDLKANRPVASVKGQLPYGPSRAAAALSADGKVVAAGGRADPDKKGHGAVARVVDADADKELAAVAVVQNQSAYVALSPDGNRLATWGEHYDAAKAGADDLPADDPRQTIQVWDAAGGKELCRVKVDGAQPLAVVFSPDGKTLAAAGGTGTVHLWEAATGAPARRLLGRSRIGGRLAFSPDGTVLAAVGAGDGAVQRWAVADGALVGTTESPTYPLPVYAGGLAFADARRVVAWGGFGSAVVAWEAPAGKLLTPAGGHTGRVTGVGFAPGGKEVLTAGQDGQLFGWDAATGKPAGTVHLRRPGTAGQVYSPLFVTPDARRVLVGDANGVAYDPATGSELFALPGPGFPGITASSATLYPSADGPRVAVLFRSYSDKVKTGRCVAWDVAAGRKLGEVDVPVPQTAAAAAVSPDGSRLVTAIAVAGEKGSATQTLAVAGWDLKSGKKLAEFTEPAGYGPVYLAAAADNASAVLVAATGKATVVDYAAGKKGPDLDLGRQAPTAPPAFSPDGKLLAVATGSQYGGGEPAAVRVYEWPATKPRQTFKGHSGAVSVLTFAPDGKTLASGSADTTVLLWDLSVAAPKDD